MSTAVAPIGAPTQQFGAASTGLPTPIDKKALTAYLALLEDPEALALQQRLAKAYDAACKSLIGENDVQKEGKGANAREFKKKSAWRKLSRYFGISTDVLDVVKEFMGNDFLVTVTVRGTAPWGQSVVAVGSCGTDEEEGRRKITMADAVGTAQTRATNRAVSDLIAMGEVSAEEIGDRTSAGDRQRPEMGLEEANTVIWPWKEPEKYNGKPLGEVSTLMLIRVQEWAAAKIQNGDRGRSVARLQEAASTVLANRSDLEAAQAQYDAEQANKKKGKDADAGAATTSSVSTEGEQRSDPTSGAPTSTPPAPTSTNASAEEAGTSSSTSSPTTSTESTRTEPTVAELNAVANTAAAQAVAGEQAAVPKATMALLTETVFKMLADKDTYAADVRAKVRKRLATIETLTAEILQAAIAEIEAGKIPF